MKRLLSRIREPFASLSHLAGAILAAVLVTALLLGARSTEAAIGFGAFLVGAIAMFGASAAYHGGAAHKAYLQRLDHAAIYLMIAGSYVPVCLLALAGAVKWTVLGLQLGLAGTGATLSLVFRKVPEAVRMVLYILMGWMALPFLGAIARGSSPSVVAWMVAGGIAYTVGAVVYATERPKLWPGRFGSHDLWHVFVLGGAGCHLGMMHALSSATG